MTAAGACSRLVAPMAACGRQEAHGGPVATTRHYARLSEAATAGWDRTVTAHGVTFTALVEALGRSLHEGRPLPPAIIDAARAIDFERRNRR